MTLSIVNSDSSSTAARCSYRSLASVERRLWCCSVNLPDIDGESLLEDRLKTALGDSYTSYFREVQRCLQLVNELLEMLGHDEHVKVRFNFIGGSFTITGR